MINFAQWIEEAKKKGTKDSSPPTVTSSPLRGANQDQSGYNGKNSVADYTISDEKINELSPELVGKVNKARSVGGKPSKTAAASKTLSMAVRKAWLKAKAGSVSEAAMVSTAGTERSTPGNMKSVGKNPNAMQKAADARRMQLDKIAQQQRDQQQKSREEVQKKREQDAATRDKIKAKSVMEGRHRKEPATEEDPGSEHVIMQLRKVISSRGIHQVKHVSGEKSDVSVKDAHKALAHHDSLKTSSEKDSYAKRLHRSASSMHDAMSGKAEKHKPKISLAGKITGNQ